MTVLAKPNAPCDTDAPMNLDSFSLAGRVAVVTGGYGVIGGSIASALAESKARVVILGRRRDAAESKAQEIRSAGGDALVVIGDVLDEQQMRAARDEVVASAGRSTFCSTAPAAT